MFAMPLAEPFAGTREARTKVETTGFHSPRLSRYTCPERQPPSRRGTVLIETSVLPIRFALGGGVTNTVYAASFFALEQKLC